MTRRLPPLLALRFFESVARHESFTRAADELCVTQAAVSHQIKALEEWFGEPLFQRLSRSIKLTDLGMKLAAPLGQAFDLMSDATEDALHEERTTVITVAVFDSFASEWIIPRLHRFRARFPEFDVRFKAKRHEDDALSSGEADIEIRYGNGNWPNHQIEHLLEETVAPVCTPAFLDEHGAPADLGDIGRYPLLHDVFAIDWAEFLGRFGVGRVGLRRGYGFTHSHLVKRACLGGLGLALGQWPLVAAEVASGALVRPFGETLALENSYYVVCRRSIADQAEVKAFAYWLLDEAELFRSNFGAKP